MAEVKCPFWPICGAAIIRQYRASRRDYIVTVCNDKKRYLACEHYKIRAGPKEAEKNETEEELTQAKKREIIVPISYIFDPLAKILRKEGLIVKNYWLNIEPSQKEVDSVIASIETIDAGRR